MGKVVPESLQWLAGILREVGTADNYSKLARVMPQPTEIKLPEALIPE